LSSGEISTELEKFTHANITSIEQLEILLLLFEENDRAWSPTDVAARLYIQPDSARDRLTDLANKGLATCRLDPEPRYQYTNSDGRRHLLVRELLEAYRIRRVAIISLVFSIDEDRLSDRKLFS